jgi:filamentous hemagglutinin family protein
MTHRNLPGSSLSSMLRAAYDAPQQRWLARIVGALGAFTPVLALANPTGGQVVAGSATIGTSGSNGVVVNQNSQRAAINWQQFSIGANEYVQFNQPNSSSVVLNRVTGNNASSIFGSIRANGQVFLINPNGILFAPGSTLDVSSLTASTLDISNSHFMAGRYVFSRDPGSQAATVVNQGSVQVSGGGYVVLQGDYVENDGTIQATTGRVVLAAGGGARLTLDNNGGLIDYKIDASTLARLAGVDNAGSITAQGGMVVMTADVANALTATAVNNSGLITAHSVRQQGGEIALLAQGGDIENSGTLDASATENGAKGGTVILHGDGTLRLASTSDIEAGGKAAKGGFVDLSGHELNLHGAVNPGRRGNLLLDPSTITIESSGTTNPSNCSGCEGGIIHTNFIQHELNAGVDLTIVASNQIVLGTGNHGATALPTAITATGNGTLALRIGTSSFNTLTGTLHGITGSIFDNGTPKNEVFRPTSGGTINITGLTINIAGDFVASASHGTVKLDTVKAADVQVTGRNIHFGNITAANNIDISAQSISSIGTTSISQKAGTTLHARHINVDLNASYGGVITLANLVAAGGSQSGEIDLQAHSNNRNTQILVNGNVTVSGKTSGSIGTYDLPRAATFIAEASGGGNGANKVKINGAISVTATAGTFHASSGNESGPVQKSIESGVGGVASTLIVAAGSNGVASVTGALTEKGPDAFAVVQAHSVSVGNVKLTGSGHSITRSIVPRFASQSYASHNNAGQAALALGDAGATTSAQATASVTAGNITISGKGVAEADLFGAQVSAGSINVTAIAAKGHVKQSGNANPFCHVSPCDNANSGGFWRGINQVQLVTGSISGGRASIAIGSQHGNGSGVQAASIKTGALSVTGVGQANIELSGKSVQTQAITAIATKGTEHGVGSSVSGVNTFVHTFKLDGGTAEVNIRSGNSGSNSSGALLTRGGGPITVTGGITATGPTANVSLKGQAVKVTGNITVTGSGGSLTSDTVFTSPSSPGYHVHYVGPGQTTGLNVEGGANGLVSIGGNVAVKGPGLVGVIVIGTTVKLHGFSASASAAETYSVLDTRISNTTTTFTGGSLAVIVNEVGGTKTAPAFAPAIVTGNVDLGAKGDIHLATSINVSGSLVVHAGGNIFGSVGSVISRFNLVGDSHPHANGGHSSGGGPSNSAAAFLPKFNAQADAIGMTAGGNIVLSNSQLTIGAGSVSTKALASDTGDAALLAGLGEAGLAPAATAPNGFFKAGGSLELGDLTMNGSYLYLQAADLSVVGKVVMSTGTLVQIAPNGFTGTTDAEGTGAAGATLNLNDNGFFNVFPDGITLVLGGTGQSGAVSLGNNGTFNIGSDNLIVDTTGTVTGLGNVISTGQVVSLSSLLNGVPPVTAGEIDPTSNTGSPGTDKNKQGQDPNLGGAGTGNQPSIGQDTNPSSVCH